jgi:hypothetical protein
MSRRRQRVDNPADLLEWPPDDWPPRVAAAFRRVQRVCRPDGRDRLSYGECRAVLIEALTMLGSCIEGTEEENHRALALATERVRRLFGRPPREPGNLFPV